MKNKRVQYSLSLLLSIFLTVFVAFVMLGNFSFFRTSCLSDKQLADYQVAPADWYYDNPVWVDFSTDESVRKYSSMIRSAVLRGVNFGGKYVVAEWGCGSSCQNHAIVNAETGKIVASDLKSSHGADYAKNSSLLILNPKTSFLNRFSSSDSKTEYYVIADDKLKLVCSR